MFHELIITDGSTAKHKTLRTLTALIVLRFHTFRSVVPRWLTPACTLMHALKNRIENRSGNAACKLLSITGVMFDHFSYSRATCLTYPFGHAVYLPVFVT